MLTRNNFTRLLLVGLLVATLAVLPVLSASLNGWSVFDAGSLFTLFEPDTHGGAAAVIADQCGNPGGSQGGGGGGC